MPSDQFNLRLRDDRAQAVRIQAARLGVKPRDVIEALIDAAPWSAIAGTADPIPGQGELAVDAAIHGVTFTKGGQRVDPETVELSPGCPECGGDVDQGACVDCGFRPNPKDPS